MKFLKPSSEQQELFIAVKIDQLIILTSFNGLHVWFSFAAAIVITEVWRTTGRSRSFAQWTLSIVRTYLGLIKRELATKCFP
jgi:hypothetical protein